jgi:4-oxalmesaconate hydratase
MIIDVHAHYTQSPPQLEAFRGWQVSQQNKPGRRNLNISDDMIRQSLQANVRQMRERGIDRCMFSPRAAGMGHDFGNALISRYWSEANNDLIGRVCKLFPEQFSPVCQLPQSPGVSPRGCLEELERCVAELGFVACNINPDVSGGVSPFTPSLGDEWWYPLWEKMVALDVPGMIHVSSTLNPAMHVNGSHYIAWDLAAVVELCNSRVFEDFPALKLIIPHGGGSIPFQFNRHRALHVMAGQRPFEEVVHNLYFDLAVYDKAAMEMIIRVIGADRVVYASEMFGTAQSIDPRTGRGFDDTVDMVKSIEWLSDADRDKIFHGNAQRLYSRAKF